MTELYIEYVIMEYLLKHGDVLKREALDVNSDVSLVLPYITQALAKALQLSYIEVTEIVTDKYLRDVLWTN